MTAVALIALVLAPGLADDPTLLKEEMAAVRQELISVKMDLRRTEARKQALAALDKLSPEDRAERPEYRAALAGDERLKSLRLELDRAEANADGFSRDAWAYRVRRAKEAVAARIKEALDLHKKRETAALESKALYLGKLKEVLEKDLAALVKQVKEAG